MQLILLPGNHISIRSWVEEVDDAISDLFANTYRIEYLHWQGDAPMLYFKRERERLKEYLQNKADYAFFAKSAGILLAAEGIHSGDFMPRFCIFVGTPTVARVHELGFDLVLVLQDQSTPILFIQNDRDPVGPVPQLKDLIEKANPSEYELVVLPGDTHDYDDLAVLRDKILPFVQKHVA